MRNNTILLRGVVTEGPKQGSPEDLIEFRLSVPRRDEPESQDIFPCVMESYTFGPVRPGDSLLVQGSLYVLDSINRENSYHPCVFVQSYAQNT
jgi:hypothetical protein